MTKRTRKRELESQRRHDRWQQERVQATEIAERQKQPPPDGLRRVPIPTLDEELDAIEARGGRRIVSDPWQAHHRPAEPVPGSPAAYRVLTGEANGHSVKSTVSDLPNSPTVPEPEPADPPVSVSAPVDDQTQDGAVVMEATSVVVEKPETVKLRHCSSCRKDKPREEFSTAPKGPGNYACNQCRAERPFQWPRKAVAKIVTERASAPLAAAAPVELRDDLDPKSPAPQALVNMVAAIDKQAAGDNSPETLAELEAGLRVAGDVFKADPVMWMRNRYFELLCDLANKMWDNPPQREVILSRIERNLAEWNGEYQAGGHE